jgi:hypothetical protein
LTRFIDQPYDVAVPASIEGPVPRLIIRTVTIGALMTLVPLYVVAAGRAGAATDRGASPSRAGPGGSQFWEARYDGPGYDGSDAATAVAVNRAGTRVFVTGWSVDPVTFTDFATVAYATTSGRRLWVARLGKRLSTAYGIAVSPDGTKVFVSGKVNYMGVSRDGTKVFVTGYTHGQSNDWATVGYNAGTGAELWAAIYDGPSNQSDIASALAVGPESKAVYVAGASVGYGQTNDDYLTVAYEA